MNFIAEIKAEIIVKLENHHFLNYPPTYSTLLKTNLRLKSESDDMAKNGGAEVENTAEVKNSHHPKKNQGRRQNRKSRATVSESSRW